MRHFCWRKNAFVCPRINVEKLWSLLSEAAYKQYKDGNSRSLLGGTFCWGDFLSGRAGERVERGVGAGEIGPGAELDLKTS